MEIDWLLWGIYFRRLIVFTNIYPKIAPEPGKTQNEPNNLSLEGALSEDSLMLIYTSSLHPQFLYWWVQPSPKGKYLGKVDCTALNKSSNCFSCFYSIMQLLLLHWPLGTSNRDGKYLGGCGFVYVRIFCPSMQWPWALRNLKVILQGHQELTLYGNNSFCQVFFILFYFFLPLHHCI